MDALKDIKTENSEPKLTKDSGNEEEKQLQQKNTKSENKEITVEEIEKLKMDSANNEKKVEEICNKFGEDIVNLLINICEEDKELTNNEKDFIVENSIRENKIDDEQKKEMLETQDKINKKIQKKKEELLEKSEKGEDLTAEEKKELETINKYEELKKLQEEQKKIEEKISNSVGKTEKDQQKLDELKKLNEEKKGKVNEKIKDCLPPQAGLIAVGPLVALIGIPPFSLIGLIAIMKIMPMFPGKEVKQEITKGNSKKGQEPNKQENNKNTVKIGDQVIQKNGKNVVKFGSHLSEYQAKTQNDKSETQISF